MGNIECCQRKNDYSEIESKEEIYIREIIDYFTKKMVSNAKLNKLSQRFFSIMLLDIEGSPLDWISEESYNDFIQKIFDKSGKTENESEIQYIILEYNKVKSLTVRDYNENNFHLLLCMWLVGMAPSRTIKDEEKINIIKKIIIKCTKYITYKTFSKFLNTFLEMMLIEITYNFQKHNPQEVKFLLSKVYNIDHVNEYCKWLCWKMGKIITDNKQKVLSDARTINNEFIRDEHLNTFFKKYSFLLQPIELRNNFYNKYK
jgi:hypothetical protein